MSNLLVCDDDLHVESSIEDGEREEEPEPTIKCGEILFMRDIRQITFTCADCGKETHKLDIFLRHTLQHHLLLDDQEVEELIASSIGDGTFDEDPDDMEMHCKVEKLDEIEFLENDMDFSPAKSADKKFIKNFENFLHSSNVSVKTERSKFSEEIADDCSLEEELSPMSEPPTVGFEIEFVEIAEGIRHYRNEETSKPPRSKRKSPKERSHEAKVATRENTDASISHICEICDKPYASRAKLKEHARTHSRKRPRTGKRFPCDLCDAKFADTSNLKVHRYRHLGFKPHRCVLCDKAFTSTTELKLHMRSHTGEKPYVCSECGKSFTSSAHLTAHRRRHLNERPYVCSTCGKSFYDSNLLRDHMISHSQERPFECEQCHMKFSRRKALKEHAKLHSGVKSYRCKICPKAFAQNAGLHSHMKSNHLAAK